MLEKKQHKKGRVDFRIQNVFKVGECKDMGDRRDRGKQNIVTEAEKILDQMQTKTSEIYREALLLSGLRTRRGEL